MTEPVAYWNIPQCGNDEPFVSFEPYDGNVFESIPLYTGEQLHPRVKMTWAEFETFKNIKQKNNLLSDALNSTAFFGNEKQQSEKQIEFANLFINLDLNNPEETIEIVPDMKLFVQKKDFNGDYRFLKINAKDLSFNHKKDKAACFDTKEEAEIWVNPLTEAVQLPVEGE